MYANMQKHVEQIVNIDITGLLVLIVNAL